MSLIDYKEVRPWAKAIRNAVVNHTMPPFYANAPLGHFEDDRRLTEAQIDAVTRWIDTGAPLGDPADAPAPVAWPSEGWILGEPDLVLEFPEYTTKGNNTDEKLILYSDHVFKDETWVQSFEFKANNYAVVHHAGINGVDGGFFIPADLVLDAEDIRANQSADGSSSGTNLMEHRNPLYTWLPGQQVERRARGDALRLRAGDRVVADVHFSPTTEPVPIRISLGVHLVNGDLDTQSGFIAGRVKDLRVPPGEPNYIRTSWNELPAGTTIDGYSLHMHLRGESSRFVFHYADGRSETVFDVPRYNFDWQRQYRLVQPFTVPAGTRVEFIAEWDNSAGNPRNPDPAAESKAGPRTVDEMYGGLVFFSSKRPQPLRVVNGVAVAVGATP